MGKTYKAHNSSERNCALFEMHGDQTPKNFIQRPHLTRVQGDRLVAKTRRRVTALVGCARISSSTLPPQSIASGAGGSCVTYGTGKNVGMAFVTRLSMGEWGPCLVLGKNGLE